MICPYLKSHLFWHYFLYFRLPRFEKVIHNETFLFQQTQLRACFLCKMRWNKIPKVCFYFCSTERSSPLFLFRGIVRRVCCYISSSVLHSEHFSLPRNCSERNSESFLFRGTAGIPPEQTKCSVYSVFHGISFWSEMANPNHYHSNQLETFQRIMIRFRKSQFYSKISLQICESRT
jgi:hypothetical protein